MPAPELMIAITAGLGQLEAIRQQVRAFTRALRQPQRIIDDVELAVDEAVTNVIKHAYPPGQAALLEIRGWMKAGHMIIAIRDFGRKYAPKPVTAADIRRAVHSHQSHGLGRYIIKKCMNSVRYRTVPGQYNETVMVKKLGR